MFNHALINYKGKIEKQSGKLPVDYPKQVMNLIKSGYSKDRARTAALPPISWNVKK